MKLSLSLKKLVSVCMFLILSHFTHAQQYVFFLHNKFIEEHVLNDAHPEYGKAEYYQIIYAFKRKGFQVISELRPKDTDARVYAKKVVGQIDSLFARGVNGSQITVIGTSKGGYIAQFVSSYLKNRDVNYVFIGSCGEEDATGIPDINFSGNVLSIYEKSDLSMQSCQNMRNRSANVTGRFKEIELNTGLKHGFLFKALPQWIGPSIKWAARSYGTEHTRTLSLEGASFSEKLDAFLSAPTEQPFNGIVLVSQDGVSKFAKVYGRPSLEKDVDFKFDDQFVIGSVSKQFTSVLLLQEYEKRRVKLEASVKTYLPELKQSWADTVTVHQLLTHTHGIIALDKPLAFKPGTQYAYSQIGYDLLARITEKTTGKSFASQSAALFRKCKMYNTFHPDNKGYQNLVPGYTEEENGSLMTETRSFENFVAAGSFISTAQDLVTWNACLHEGKLLSASTYKLMTTKQKNAVRNHPIFGAVAYGYGITVDSHEEVLQLGQTGFTPGFISMNFYFPKTKTSIIALDNVVWDEDNLKSAFQYHSGMLKMIRESKLVKRKY